MTGGQATTRAASRSADGLPLPRATFAMNPASLVGELFDERALTELRRVADIDPGLVLTSLDDEAAQSELARTEILVAGWDAPVITAEQAARATRLRAVVYAGGVAATCLEDPAALAARGVVASHARRANAVPVAEYTLATILLSGKRAFAAERHYREHRAAPDRSATADIGNYARTVGIVGASHVGRAVLDLLRPFDLDVVLHDPTLPEEEAQRLGARLLPLDALMAAADVVSLHQPLTPATRGQIATRQLALMPDGATLVNTARGAVVDQDALVAELRTGRISAVLDVTDPEPLPRASVLWDLPNVVLTPHIAGSMGRELRRLGDSVVAEVARFAAGEPFAHPDDLAVSARR
ncbi:2-hydroxyacid dehydrogenase [Streptomyces brasiliensis]|uniref:2-hydroxyacid dehydrogenase n=2 Tax=Streptomyces brasiliensis TaxID=1954 RepID=A0A917L351_9ACTN|nr:hydroxyacid dehydrogenase [Streptomyces brasiliensis]GGJ40522.1 2-hydroxyacid dehydrogenase [Streptomyces brasiliensis]